MTAKWFVTVDKHCMYPNDPDAYVWTLSHDPNETGWETDSGYSGYGLLKRDAEELANAANRIEQLEAALRSIAANSCCNNCREAALVARKALEVKDD